MDPNQQTLEKPESNLVEEHQSEITIQPSNPKTVLQPLFSTASISLSLSNILPTHLLLPPKPSSLLSSPSYKLKIPSQISQIFLSSSSLSRPPKPSIKSTISASTLQTPLSNGPHRSSDPSNAAAIRRSSIVWFRNDLRVLDNECLNSANNESFSVLPVYCFDPRDYTNVSNHATFLIESVADLRRNLQSRGSDLVVKIGKPEIVLVELAKAIGANAVYAHREISENEVQLEEKIEVAMKEEGVEVKYFWGSTLYHVDDFTFKLEEMPMNYNDFREKVQRVEVRKTMEAPDQLKGLPMRGDVEPGEIPSLSDLGFSPTAKMSQDRKSGTNASLMGGETEALQRLRKIAAECWAQPQNRNKDGSMASICGANFACKISPWLTTGCISPRSIFDELNKSTTRMVSSAASTRKDGGSSTSVTGMSWLMSELLWRDFFRFITKKYSSTKKMLEGAPATACTGALA